MGSMASNPVASRRQRRRPKPGLRSSLRRHFRSERNCHPRTCNQNFSKRQKRSQQDDCRNQQYSIVAMTNSAAAIVERYAYSPYGEPVFATGAGVVLTESAKDNRYTYTGREWDEGLGLYHFRARMYDAESGRFCGRDPIGFEGGSNNIFQFVAARACSLVDPLGLNWNLGRPTGVPNPGSGSSGGRPRRPCCGGEPYDPKKKGCCNKRTYNTMTECCITNFIIWTKRSKAQCCLDAIISGQAGNSGGGVICCDGMKVSCTWNINTGNGQADFIISHCIRKHEDDHHDVVDCTGKECGGITRPTSPGIDLNDEECGAYKVEIDCLESMKGTCVTAACTSAVQGRIEQIRSYALVTYGCVLSEL